MKILGMISGTSHDGIDMALVSFTERGGVLTGTVLASSCEPYDPALRARLIAALPPAGTTLSEVCELDTLIGQAFAAAAAHLLEASGPADAVCSHGQTVYHWVDGPVALGTLQIGQPAWIAERTGCPVVSDIRIRDITAGGQGAPLASFIDYLLLKDRGGAVALNLGGISNMTVVGPESVSAFDVGPANALIDAVVVTHGLNPQGFDADGAIARSGRVDDELLAELLADPYYRLPAPKSTGKEYFNYAYVEGFVARHSIGLPDLVATLTELTVRTVADAVRTTGAGFLVVSGGGAHNPVIMEGLRARLPGVDVQLSDVLGVAADSKEAVLMALIGWCTLHGVPAIVPGGTGAREPRILGAITPGAVPLVLPPVKPVTSLRLTPDKPVLLRVAAEDDLPGIIKVFTKCWRGYQGVPASVIDGLSDADAEAMWRQVAATDLPSIVVAVRDGEIVGFTRFVASDGEGMVHSLYVSPEAQGAGLGGTLLDHALASFARQGIALARLWVFAANAAGIGFYRARGWRPDGATRVEQQFGEPELRLVKAVA